MVFAKRKQKNRLKPDPVDVMRRLRRGAAGTFALAFLALCAVWVSRLLEPQTFPIRQIQVTEGLPHTTPADVVQRAAPLTDVGFFLADVDAIRHAVVALPWVRAATVRRIWPDKLRVSVVEQDAFAIWLPGGLLNPAGERFTPARDTHPEGLPELSGPAGTEAFVASQYRSLRELLTPLGVNILRLSVDERRAARLQLDNGLELLLGRGDGVRALVRFAQAYEYVLAPRVADIDRVDLRYTNGFAVRWKQPPTPGGLMQGETL